MSIMGFKKLIEKLDRHEDHYHSLIEIMRELQPVAFLISASLILAVFLNNEPTHQRYALFASVLFFLSYLGFAFYKIFKYKWYFYWGLSLIVLSTYFLYSSFGDVISIILKNNIDKTFLFIVSCVITSMLIVGNKHSLDICHNKNQAYKIINLSFWVEFVLILIFLPASIYINIYIFNPGFFLIGTLLLMNLILIPLSQMWIRNKK